MRRSQVSYLLTLAAFLLVLLGSAGTWALLRWPAAWRGVLQRWLADQGMVVGAAMTDWIVGGVLALALLLVGIWLQRFMQLYFFRIQELTEDLRLILAATPDRRLSLDAPASLRALTTLLNQFADRHQQILYDQALQVQQARADLEEERNRLAALMAELSEGVVVCNRDGRILLYNVRARHLLDPPQPASAASREGDDTPSFSGYVGLGRSIFGLLDRNAITYGLSRLQRQLERQQQRPQGDSVSDHTGLILAAANGNLLRIRMASVIGVERTLTGFVLTLQDITATIQTSSRRDFLLQSLTERTRGGLANIRAAIEMLEQFPTMSAERAQRFHTVIQEEAAALGQELDATMRNFAGDLRAQWRFEEVHGGDLIWALQQHLTTQQELGVKVIMPDESLWLKVDSYTLIHGIATAVKSIQAAFGVTTVALRLHPLYTAQSAQGSEAGSESRRYITLDVHWPSPDLSIEAWLEWQQQVSTVDAGDATLSLREVAEIHGSEVWFQHDPTTAQSYFRLLLPMAEGQTPSSASATPLTATPPPDMAATIASRPEYYDFDLFQPSDQRLALAQRPLETLTYTIFDTETTGLDPQRDEIISIGAVRVLTGRILRQELFDQLIDPRRPIPHLATHVHGIDDTMVQGRPTIAQVLPRFYHFAEETVLVGHNVAFDLRLLARKEQVTGVHFGQPILDTLLLSEVLQPNEKNHELEAIAARLGVNVLGRHTALGDALVTAEVFLRMIPLLREAGIRTLDQALAAARKTYMARITY
ncbi:MAG: exonuclease domain-containing protein [Caldilineaceae bacterium]